MARGREHIHMTTRGQSRLRKFLTDRNISLLIRWWAAGAVYFFIGWGTFLGRQQSILDFVVSLGLVMGLFNILIINPALRLLFNIGRRRPAHENTYWQHLSDYLVELLKNIFIVFMIALVYRGINLALIWWFSLPADTVPLSGEPILFGVFYVLVFVCLDFLSSGMKDLLLKWQGGGSRP
jgi:hypothetical protein